MLLFHRVFGLSVGGLLPLEFQGAPWSIAKLWDLLKQVVLRGFDERDGVSMAQPANTGAHACSPATRQV